MMAARPRGSYIRLRPDAQPVRALDGIVHVPAPVIFTMLPSDAAIPPCAATVWTGSGRLGDVGSLQPGFGQAEGRAQAGAAGADDNHVKGMVSKLVPVVAIKAFP